MRRLLFSGLLALATATTLHAEAVMTFYGRTTASGPTFDRPYTVSTLSGIQVPYDVVGFTPNAGATCSIYSTQEGGSYNGHIALYSGLFNPATPLSHLIAVNDDFSLSDGGLGVGTSAIEQIELDASTRYYLVTSGYWFFQAGSYSVTISCQNPATRILSPNPGGLPSYDGRYHAFRNGRFLISATWRDFAGSTGYGTFVPMASSDSGILWFFAPTNWEVLIKVLDACDFNNRYWVFYAATTNVEFKITVYDLYREVSKTYTNPLGVSAAAVTDTNALATCP